MWNREKIIEEVEKCRKILNVDYFPSHSELTQLTGNRALAVAISKHGGTDYFASEMGLEIKNCESKLGNKYELKAIEDIKLNTNLNSEKMKVRYPYDLLTCGSVKIDVKVSRPCSKGKFKNFSCNLEKADPTCDIFIIYCIDNDGSAIKTLIIPAAAAKGLTQIGIGNLSTWDVYVDNWKIIKEYSLFHEATVLNKQSRPRSV